MSRNFFDRVPPQDLEAERSVIGCLLFDSDSFDDVARILTTECFYADSHRKIFATIGAMIDSGVRAVDVITLAHELNRTGTLESVGGPAYLNEIMGAVPHAAHAEYYAEIVYERWTQRLVIEASTDSIRDAFAGVENIVEQFERRALGISERKSSGIDARSLDEILKDTFQAIFERMDSPDHVSGQSSGLYGLDGLIGGFHPTELLVLAARPSMGKTALVCNFALSVAIAGSGALIFSLEQSSQELAERLLCAQAKVSGHSVRSGRIDDVEQGLLHTASETLKALPIFVDDTPARTMPQIAAIARRTNRRSKLGVIVIDYLQLIESDDRGMPREQQVATITRRLKFLAKDLNVPIVALAQLNRGVESREDKRPRLSDLRESGAIEQDADVVMFLHRADAYDPEDRPGEAELIVAKNRHGSTGTVDLVWIRDQLRFGDRAQIDVGDGFE